MTWETLWGIVFAFGLFAAAGWLLVALLEWITPGPAGRHPVTDDEDEIDHRFY